MPDPDKVDISQVRADLAAEHESLDRLLSGLSPEQWSADTPSPGWTVTDQIGHLAYFDLTAALAITDPESFAKEVTRLQGALTASDDPDEKLDELTLGKYKKMPPDVLLGEWRRARETLHRAAADLENDSRVVWYGPAMGSKSFLTARLMETWAHGQDIAKAVEARLPASNRLRHIARLGFITRKWSYQNRGREAPQEPVRVTLAAPDGETWLFGPEDAPEQVTGPAEDFCLVVTQRIHPDDTNLQATPQARDWLLIAQAFAGPPTTGPAPATQT